MTIQKELSCRITLIFRTVHTYTYFYFFFLYSILTVQYRVGCDGSPGQGDNCCTSQNQCGEIEGDCDADSDCYENLKCGTNNCPIQGNFKVIHPKYYKHLKKGAHQSHLGRQKWAD